SRASSTRYATELGTACHSDRKVAAETPKDQTTPSRRVKTGASGNGRAGVGGVFFFTAAPCPLFTCTDWPAALTTAVPSNTETVLRSPFLRKITSREAAC